MTVVYTNGFTSLADFTTSEQTGSGGTRAIVSNQYQNVTVVTSGNTQQTKLGSGFVNLSEVRATIFFTVTSTADSFSPQLLVRASNDWAAGDASSSTTGYKTIWVAGNRQLYRMVGGTATQLGSNVALSISTAATYGMTIECTGTTIRSRMWDAAGAEPGTWDISTTDANVAGPGVVQFCMFGQGAVREIRWDNLSVDDLQTVTGPPVTRPSTHRFAG